MHLAFETGIPIVGHVAVYIQDADGNWYFTEYAGKNKKDARIRFYEADDEQIQKFLDNKCLYGKEYVYYEGDFSKSYEYAKELKDTDYGGYNLFKNNCVGLFSVLTTKDI